MQDGLCFFAHSTQLQRFEYPYPPTRPPAHHVNPVLAPPRPYTSSPHEPPSSSPPHASLAPPHTTTTHYPCPAPLHILSFCHAHSTHPPEWRHAHPLACSAASVPDPPIIFNQSYTLNEDEKLTVTAANGLLRNASDGDGDPIAVFNSTNPAHGTLVVQPNGSFVYMPYPNYNGQDGFQFVVTDNVFYVTGLVNITVGERR